MNQDATTEFPTPIRNEALSLADAIASKDLHVRSVEVPEWGGVVYMREMDGRQLAYFVENANIKGDQMEMSVEFMARVITMCWSDKDGNLIGCQPSDPNFEDQARQLTGKSATVLQRVFMVASSASGITGKALEEAEGK